MDFAGIGGIVEKAREAYGIPGVAVAVVRGDETFVKGFGHRELGGSEPVDPDTLFAVGSVTKAFTTTAMAMLIDEGKMSWEDHPRKHVPGFKLHDALADANVTLRDLVSHRTGLARHDCLWYNSKWTSEDLLGKIAHLPLTFSFRSTYQYNNLMYMVAGMAVASASGMPWADFVRTRILEPLGMRRSILSVSDLQVAGNYCAAHEKEQEKTVKFHWTNVDSVNACGSLISCARDLANWVRFQLGNGEWKGKRLVSKERLAETHAPQMVVPVDDSARELGETTITSYCLGWNLQNYRDYTIVAHGGSIDGFNAGVVLVPKADAGVAVLSNLCSDNTVWSLRSAIVDHILGLPPKHWVEEILALQKANREKADKAKADRSANRAAGTTPSHSLDHYAGEYFSNGYGTVAIKLDGGALCLTWNNHRAKLDHWHFNTFAGKYEPPDWPTNIEALFELSSSGAVSSMRLIWPDTGLEHVFGKAK